jgi:hypothetical protein
MVKQKSFFLSLLFLSARDLFLALIKATTILHAHQRQKNEQGHLVATMEDYEHSYKVFHEIEKATTLGLGQNVIDFFQNIITPLWKEQQVISDEIGPHLTYEDILTKHQEIFEEPITRGTLREHYLQPLENKGLIDIEESPEDRRRKIITVKNTLPDTSLINDEQFKKRIANEAGCDSVL